MTYIVFENNGEIDERAITTMAVSTKENDNAIGYFGTGLKYAIAVILRNSGSITIQTGTKELRFSSSKETIRGNDFHIVKMNRTRLGFTTDLGKNWEVWQAFRELYCNAMDEFGTCYESKTKPTPEAGKTKIYVKLAALETCFRDKHQIVLESTPIFENNSAAIHPGESKYLYYRNIRVAELRTPSLYTYNIKRGISLTEDRTIKYEWEAHTNIAYAIEKCKDRTVLMDILTSKGIEKNMFSFEYTVDYSDEFFETCQTIRHLRIEANPTITNFLHKEDTTFNKYEPIELTIAQQKMVEVAKTFLINLGINIAEYPVKFVKTLGNEVLGKAENATIYISERVFHMGTKMLTGTLYEEYIHLKHGYRDRTREMQNYLIDTIMSLGELLTDKPL